MIAATGARRVIFNCPSCLRIVKKEYAEWGVTLPDGIELLHLTELLAELLAAGGLGPLREVARRIAYHDPCELGRRQGIYDAPRAVLAAIPGVQIAELQLTRDRAVCCGAGGGLAATNLPLVIEASKYGVTLAGDVSAQVLVTACPTCKQTFSRHTGRRDDMETRDVAELVAMSLGVGA
jgi:Fe-S oxidoreductase